MTVTLTKNIVVQERYKLFLRLISTLLDLNLAEREIDILNSFFWHAAGNITTESRKEVCEELDITEFNLNNYLRKLRRRNVVTETEFNEKIKIDVAPTERSFGIMFALQS